MKITLILQNRLYGFESCHPYQLKINLEPSLTSDLVNDNYLGTTMSYPNNNSTALILSVSLKKTSLLCEDPGAIPGQMKLKFSNIMRQKCSGLS